MAGRGGPLQQPPADHHLGAEANRQTDEQAKWDAWRAAHPARLSWQLLARKNYKRPGKSQQKQWTV